MTFFYEKLKRGFKIELYMNGSDTWMCWNSGEAGSEVTSHGWSKKLCFCRKQRHLGKLSPRIGKQPVVQSERRMRGFDDSTPLSFFSSLNDANQERA